MPGRRGQAAVEKYLAAYQSVTALPIVPTSLVNFGEAVNFPLIFGGILAIQAASTLVHLLVLSVSRRRRERGLLRALGFVERQLVATVAWQAMALAAVGIVIGVPLGVVLGRRGVGRVRQQPRGCAGAGRAVLASRGYRLGILLAANLLAVLPALQHEKVQATGAVAGQVTRKGLAAPAKSFSGQDTTSACLESSFGAPSLADSRLSRGPGRVNGGPLSAQLRRIEWLHGSFAVCRPVSAVQPPPNERASTSRPTGPREGREDGFKSRPSRLSHAKQEAPPGAGTRLRGPQTAQTIPTAPILARTSPLHCRAIDCEGQASSCEGLLTLA